MASYVEFKNFVQGVKPKVIPSLEYWAKTSALYVVAFREGSSNEKRIKVGLSTQLMDRFANYHYQHPGHFLILAIAKVPPKQIWKSELMLMKLLHDVDLCNAGCESMRVNAKASKKAVRALYMIAKYYGNKNEFFTASDIKEIAKLAHPQIDIRKRERVTTVATDTRLQALEKMVDLLNKTELQRSQKKNKMPIYKLIDNFTVDSESEEDFFPNIELTPKSTKNKKDWMLSPEPKDWHS